MKPIALLLLGATLGAVLTYLLVPRAEASAEREATEMITEPEPPTAYDPELAARLGADDYGMRKYVMAFLKAGPNRDRDSTEAAELQAAHMANIGRMAEEGKLSLAGPFFGDGALRGIYIFNVESIAEAEALTNSDPAIQAGSLEMELLEWYGSAAVMEVNALHKKVQKTEM